MPHFTLSSAKVGQPPDYVVILRDIRYTMGWARGIPYSAIRDESPFVGVAVAICVMVATVASLASKASASVAARINDASIGLLWLRIAPCVA